MRPIIALSRFWIILSLGISFAATSQAQVPPLLPSPMVAPVPTSNSPPAPVSSAPNLASTTISALSALPGEAGGGAAPASKQSPVDPLFRKDTPRRLLETFYFCLEGVDYKPELIQEAANCLDNRLFSEGAATLDLTAFHLGEILNHFGVPLVSAPESSPQDEVVLINQDDTRIAFRRGPDSQWRFSPETVQKVAEMRRSLKAKARAEGAGEKQFLEAFRSPEATFRTFRQAMARGDFAVAATCLDSTGHSQQMWDIRGPLFARDLAFAVQRLGFIYCAELPGESSGSSHCWRVIPPGQVTLDRISLPDGKLAWKFSRATLEGLPKLVNYFRLNQTEPDPRWKRLGLALDSSVLKEIGAKSEKDAKKLGKSVMVPVTGTSGIDPAAGRQTPRSAVITFLKLCEELRVRPEVRENLHNAMDLVPLEDQLGRKMPGTKAALMIEAILRTMEIDTNILSDIPNDEPQTIKGFDDLSLTLRRMKDGAWRFDQETLLRLRDMYNKLPQAQRNARDRTHDFQSARETYGTFTWSMFKGEMDNAVDTLDLSELPAAARGALGPRLAWKLRYVLDRNKYILPQEVPGTTEGRRWLVFRTTKGDMIQVGKRHVDPNKDRWLFTPETLQSIEHLFPLSIGESPLPDVTDSFWFREGPDFLEAPSVWLHLRVPPALRKYHLGLADWQWLGLGLGLMVSWLIGLVVSVGARLLIRPFLRSARIGMAEELLAKRTRPIQMLVAYGVMLLAVDVLDLPLSFMGKFLPITLTCWLLLAFWAGHNLIDLGLELYNNRPGKGDRASIRDLMAPTLTLVLKAILVFIFGYWLISLLGNPDLLTQILAGMGIVGLAVSLAAQDAIKHFFGTLLLISEGPFKIGDRIVIDKYKGVVEAVGFRSTRIRTDKGTLLVLPNSVLAGGSVENLGRRNRNFARLTIPILELPDNVTLEIMRQKIQSICRDMMPGMKSVAKVDTIQAEGGKPPALRVRTWLPGWGGVQAENSQETLQDSVACVAVEHGLVPLVDIPSWPSASPSVANAA